MHEPVVGAVVAVVLLLLVAAAAAMGLKRVNLPYTVGLVLVGLALGTLADVFDAGGPIREIELSPELILFVFLPTLIFESAFNLDSRLLAQNLTPVLVLAAPGLLVSTTVVGALVAWLTPLDWGPALLFGALISATDPVAVIALFKEVGAPKRLAILVEGESLFNDATAIVLFGIILAVVQGGAFDGGTLGRGALDFVVVFVGGVLVGAAIGYVMVRTIAFAEDDPLVEVSLTTVVAYAAFIAADHYLHVSGVMATVGAGLVVGTLGSTRFTPEARAYLHQFWEYAAFAANSLIFLLVGMSVHLAVLARHLVPIGLTIAAVLVARAVTVYGLAPAITRLPGAEPIDGPTRFVLFWGGLRGAVALALVLSLPTSFPSADLLVVLAVGVVLFTLLSGGLTMRPLMHALGLDRPGLVERAAAAQASLAAKRSALERIRGLGDATHVSRRLLTDLETEYGGAVRDAEIQLDELRRSCSPDEMRQVLWAEALAVERQAYREGFEHGAISEPVLRELELSTDLRRDRLRRREIPSTVEWATPVEIRLTDFLLRLWGGVAPRSALVRRHRLRTLVAQYERDTAVLEATERVTGAIAHMAELTGVEPGIAEECRASYQRFASDAMGRIDAIGEHFPEYAQAVHERAARRIALDGELDALEHLVAEGGIPENVVREAQRQATQAQRRLQRTAVSGLEPNPEEILARVPFFAGLDSAAVASVVNALVPRTYTAGAVIIRQGDRGTSLFLISRGVVAVVLRRDDGREARVASLQPGDFFGEMALLSAEPRSATVRAVTACHLYELAKRDVDAICESVPAVRLALIRASEERTRRLIEEKQRRASGASPRAGDSGSTTPGGR